LKRSTTGLPQIAQEVDMDLEILAITGR
jgi:hypothetical protein